MKHLILASTSPYRRELLQRLGLAFNAIDPGIQEAVIEGESPPERALRLATEKARACASAGSVVIGSDQVAARGRKVLHKPGSAEIAIQQLVDCQGQQVDFFTGVTIFDGQTCQSTIDHTTVVFKNQSRAAIERYVSLEQPLNCAGGFKVEGLGIALFERVESTDPTALIGLPMIWVAETLRTMGLDPLG